MLDLSKVQQQIYSLHLCSSGDVQKQHLSFCSKKKQQKNNNNGLMGTIFIKVEIFSAAVTSVMGIVNIVAYRNSPQ